MASIPTGGITIDNLPSASGINDTDAVIISRSGKAYKTTAITEQINTLNADLTDMESGSGIFNTDYINESSSAAVWYKCGCVCVVAFTLVFSAGISTSNEAVVSGLPKASTQLQFVAGSSSGGVTMRITTSGNLAFAWHTYPSSGTTLRGSVMYLTPLTTSLSANPTSFKLSAEEMAEN